MNGYNIRGLQQAILDVVGSVQGLIIEMEGNPVPLFIDLPTLKTASTYGDKKCFNYITSYLVCRPIGKEEYDAMVASTTFYGRVNICKENGDDVQLSS